MRRLHHERRVVVIDDAPRAARRRLRLEQALPRATSGTQAGLSWLEGTRYEDQPTLTRAYMQARRIAVVPDVVYHWRMRDDGSSITQQRARSPTSTTGGPPSACPVSGRWTTARPGHHGLPPTGSSPGDLHRYFVQIPGCADDVVPRCSRPACGSSSAPVRWSTARCPRCTGSPAGWSSRAGARTPPLVMAYVAALPARRAAHPGAGRPGVRLDVPGLDAASVDRRPSPLRDHEV